MFIDNDPEDEMEDETTEVENEEGDETPEVETAEVETQPEPELPAAVQIVQAALQGNAVGVKDIFKAALSDRIADLVADRKEQIANSLITPDQPEESDNEETENDNPSDNVQGSESE